MPRSLAALLCVLALSLLSHSPCRAGEPGSIRQELNVRYGDDSIRQVLDVFAPQDARDCPVVLFVHGGGWTVGDKNLFGLYRGVGKFFARHGVVAVLINYRLSPFVKHPEHVKDVARAFAWTRRHIRDHGGNPDQIILCAHSAGGHLVALLATDDQYLKAPELKLYDSDRAALRGVIAISGVYRIPGPEEFVEMVGGMLNGLLNSGQENPHAMDLVPAWLRSGKRLNPFRMVFGDDPKVCKQASPLNHVHKGLPPFLLLHAEDELPMLKPMAREFRDALEKAGVPVELCPIDGCHHNTILFRLHRPNDPTAEALLRFVEKIKGQRVASPRP
jgi:acetyl esterase/lipase